MTTWYNEDLAYIHDLGFREGYTDDRGKKASWKSPKVMRSFDNLICGQVEIEFWFQGQK
jgi:hypothetical protein